MTAADSIGLDELRPGQSGTVVAMRGDDPALTQRLMALGILEGAGVKLTRKAVGGDPIEIEVMGYALSLRREEARMVRVQPDA